MKKITLVIAAVLLVLGFAIYSHFDSAARSIIESAGTQALGTPVHVGGVSASFATRAASISGLAVDNPPGFAGKFLETKSVAATLGGVEGKTVTIKEIVVDGMTITYAAGAEGTNFDVLRQRLKSAPAASSTTGENANDGYKVIIRKLRIVDATVVPAIGKFNKTVKLPEIIVSNIGSKEKPATPQQVAKQVTENVLAVSSTAAFKLGLKDLPADLNVDKVKNKLNGLLSR